MGIFLWSGCQPVNSQLDPMVLYSPPKNYIQHLPSPFAEVTEEELRQPWGKELLIGQSFAREIDLYRAITSFKRALILLPASKLDRCLQIEYEIVLCYYFGQKYAEAIEAFEDSRLFQATADFPAFNELVLVLYESYEKLGQVEKARSILDLLQQSDAQKAQMIQLSTALAHADFAGIATYSQGLQSQKSVDHFLRDFQLGAKSVRKAQLLNAALPGAGYWYVGQKKSALTSFLINALFIAAAYQFFDHGHIAAGLITTSFEMGWYFGGINGAGLEAKQYNHYLYQTGVEKMMVNEGLFPVLLFQASF
ncbi:hypothetical protein PARA125_000805 [Parachlamydia sp. AcF125]|nr:hypothetical protein [Parachlamydia sp. AcF125]